MSQSSQRSEERRGSEDPEPPTNCCMSLPWPGFFNCENMNAATCLAPILCLSGGLQIALGFISVFLVRFYEEQIDTWYARKTPKVMMYLGGLILLSNGILLIFALTLKKRSIMWLYILMSTVMCIYILILSIVMINCALNNVVFDVHRMSIDPPGGDMIMRDGGVVIGFITLSTAVLLFFLNIGVCAHYNVSFSEPLLLRGNT